jgi:hypothetical protein
VTAAQRQTMGGLVASLKEWAPVAGGLVALAYFILQGFAFVTGGMKPQTQITADALTAKIDSVQGDVTKIKAALDILPSPYEVGDQRAHFSRLDDRMNKVEGANQNIEGRVTALERQQSQFRNPPH